MKTVRAVFIGGYRISHACVSLQFDHNLIGIDHTYIVTPFDIDRLKRIFKNYHIDTSNFTFIHDSILLEKYPDIVKWNNLPDDYRGTWLLQQGLKLAILDYLDDADVILIQDPDSFCIKPYECVVDGKPNLFYLPNERHSNGYYDVLKNALGIERQTPHCFVSELMPTFRQDWLSLKARAESHTGKNVWDAIIDGVPYEGHENLKWFSEFEFLGNWMITKRPCEFTEQKRFQYKSLEEISVEAIGDYHNCICDAVPKLNDSILLNFTTDEVMQFDFVIGRLAPLLHPNNFYYKDHVVKELFDEESFHDHRRISVIFTDEIADFYPVATNIARSPVFSIDPPLPPGLIIDQSSGHITGMPVEASDNNYTITVTDNISKTEYHTIGIVVKKRVKVYNDKSTFDVFNDWFGDSNDKFMATTDINEIHNEDIKIGCLPLWTAPSPDHKKLDLILTGYNETTPLDEAITWIEDNLGNNFLLALGSHMFESEFPPNVIYRPWWMFNTINNNSIVPDSIESDPEYDFDVLLGAKKSHRDFLMALFQKNNMLDKSIVMYRELFTAPENKHADVEIATELLLQGDQLLYPYVSPNLDPAWEVPNINKAVSGIVPWEIYKHTKYSIIAESLPAAPFFFTEKPTKALLGKRVIVPFACQYYLRSMKNMGFKTFDCIIDESFDEIKNDVQRFSRAFQQVKFLSTLDYREVQEKTKEIREHNFNRLFEYKAEIKETMLEMVYNKIKEIKHVNSIQ